MGQFFILRCRKPCTLKHRVQQEYNSLLVNALNRIFKGNLSWNNFKWLLTKLELLCVRNIIPRSRKRLWNGYPVLNQELQITTPLGGTYPYRCCMGVPPPPRDKTSTICFFYFIVRNTWMAEPCEGQANWSEAEDERERSQQLRKENIWKKKNINKQNSTHKLNERKI